MRRAAGTSLLGLAVGLALADSSVVTLALPEILGQFDVDITTVAWVLTSYNLALALLAVPAAYLARQRPHAVLGAGAVVFAGASLACGLASSFGLLVAGRCVQALGGALVVAAALALLRRTTGSDERAAHVWVLAGVLGASLGPAAGGILTQALGWESIFLVQVPLALLPLAVVVPFGQVPGSFPGADAERRGADPDAARAGRPAATANFALLLLSGGLVAALFLLVLLLVDGWAVSPAAAGLVVTVIPLVAIAAGRFAPPSLGVSTRIAAGVILVAGGLVCLAFMPRAGWAWTLAPQLLVGAGLGLTLPALTEWALAGRPQQVVHAGWTIAARHAGVVLGLLLLAPVLTNALEENREKAVRAGAAEVLDSGIPPLDKLRLAQDVLDEVERARDEGELPRVAAVFEDRPDDEEYGSLHDGLQEQLDRAVTDAFSSPFLLAAALALSALVVLALGYLPPFGRREPV